MSTIPTAELLAALALVKPAIPAKPSLPMLSCVTLAPGRVAAFDFEWSVEVTSPLLDGLPSVALPYGLLSDAVKAAQEDTLTLTSRWSDAITASATFVGGPVDAAAARLRSGSFSYGFDRDYSSEMPAFPTAPDVLTLHGLDAAEWARVARALVAVGKDDTLPTLTAVQLTEHGGSLYALASDRYRLAVSRVALEAVPGWSCLVPAAVVQAYTGIAKGRPVEVWGGQGERAWLRTPGILGDDSAVEMGFIPQDGPFPLVMSLLEQEKPSTATVDRLELIAAVRTVAKFIERNEPVKLIAERGQLTVRGGDATSTLGYTGKLPGMAAFNPGYLRDGLAAITGDRVTVSWTLEGKPYLFGSVEDDTLTYLLMPVRLTS